MPGLVCARCGFVNELDADALAFVSSDQLGLLDPDQLGLLAAEAADDPKPVSEKPNGGRPTGRGKRSRAARSHPTLAVDGGKPPYRVPSMAEVAEIPRNGLSLVSTFSGAGGSCLGFRMAGFRTILASEFVPAAADTYAANFPDVPIAVDDVRDLEPALVLERFGLERRELDVLEGSPPCSSFSMAGKRERGWRGDAAGTFAADGVAGAGDWDTFAGKSKYSDVGEQATVNLFGEYARLVAGLMPRVFVAENVAGFMYGGAAEFRAWLERDFAELGYAFAAKLLDASELGVPQARKRAILIGVRRDVGLSPLDLYPEKLGYRYSMREALEGVEPTDEEKREVSIERFAIGKQWDVIGGVGQSEKFFQLVRPDPERPLPTLTQTAGSLGAASVVHPTEKRKFTVAEAKRLCSFPDDFVLTGSYEQRIERLGRAVPPLMMRAVAARIASALGGTPAATPSAAGDPFADEPE